MIRLAHGLLTALIVLCSLAGCAARQEQGMQSVLVLRTPDCPSPEPPRLPKIRGDEPFDSGANITLLLERDDLMRAYITGLEASMECCRGVSRDD